ncbi:facilitated trehalose transporter Tret1-like [Haemaphysalis longicornis]
MTGLTGPPPPPPFPSSTPSQARSPTAEPRPGGEPAMTPPNAAMEALRRWRPTAKGGTPASDPDSGFPCGHHVRAMLTACLPSVAAGAALGFGSAAMPSIEPQPWYDVPRSPPHNRWFADILLLGAAMGALASDQAGIRQSLDFVLNLTSPGHRSAAAHLRMPAGPLVPLVGHRRTLLLCGGGMFAAWCGLVVSNSVAMLLVARAVGGFWVGVATNCASLYVGDVAPPEKRTLFGGITELATSTGTLMAYTIGGLSWDIQASLCALISAPVLVMQRYVIESPRWLLARGRSQDADTAMARLYGLDPPPEFKSRKRSQEEQQLSVVFPTKWPQQAGMVLTCFLLHLLPSLSGAQLCLLRAVQVSGQMVAAMPANVVAMILLAVHVCFAALFDIFTPVVGRRRLLAVSAVLVSAVLFLVQPLPYLGFRQWSVEEEPLSTSWGGVFSVLALVLAYSVGLCHLPALLTGELGPWSIRFIASAFVWAVRWIGVFLLLHRDADLVNAAQNAGLVFSLAMSVAVAAAAGAVFVLMPDNEGRSLAVADRNR